MGMAIDEAHGILSNGLANAPSEHEWCVAFKVAIDTMRKYQLMQANYENRLKADLVAILTETQLEIEEEKASTQHLHYDDLENAENYNNGIDNCIDIIQEKINELKRIKDDKYKSHENIK